MRAQKHDESFFAYWISFWPTAPFFGVAWRFEKMAPFAGFYAPSSVMAGMARASAAEAAKAAEEAVEAVEDAAEIVVEAAEVEAETVEATAAAFDVATADGGPEPTQETAPEAEPSVDLPRPAGLLGQAPLLTDDLKLIKGVGPKLEQILNDLGVFTFAQIAAFGPDDCAWVEAQVAAARARPLPADWAEQAREKA